MKPVFFAVLTSPSRQGPLQKDTQRSPFGLSSNNIWHAGYQWNCLIKLTRFWEPPWRVFKYYIIRKSTFEINAWGKIPWFPLISINNWNFTDRQSWWLSNVVIVKCGDRQKYYHPRTSWKQAICLLTDLESKVAVHQFTKWRHCNSVLKLLILSGNFCSHVSTAPAWKKQWSGW